MTDDVQIAPFRIEIPQAELDDLAGVRQLFRSFRPVKSVLWPHR